MNQIEVTVDGILKRFIEASNLKNIQEIASEIYVSANSISGWKARNSVGVAFEAIYPYLLKHEISLYYVFFGIGEKSIKISEPMNKNSIEERLDRIEAMLSLKYHAK